jgi:ABC-type Na+ efflux pump permease subunit
MTNNEFSKLLDKKLAGVATAKDVERLDEGLTKVERAMVTKKDLNNLVTKEEAREFATKEDLKGLAAKKDLDLVKEDVSILKKDVGVLKENVEVVRGDVQKVDFQLKLTEQRFEQKLEDTFSKYMKEMLDKFDRVIGELQMIREENVFRQAQFERLVERVERLEQHAGLQPLPTTL